MRSSKTILSILLLLNSIVGVGCERESVLDDPCLEKNTVYLGGEFATMNYGIGSYWLMMDSTNQSVDTVRITQFEHGFISNLQCGNPEIECYRYQIQLPYHETEVMFLLTPAGLIMSPDALGHGAVVFYGTEGAAQGHENVETHAEMQVGQELYQDVSVCRLDEDPVRGELRTDFYISAAQGFLRLKGYEADGTLAFDKVVLRGWIFR